MQDQELLDAQSWYGDEIATLGDRLAGAREARGLTQSELAAQLGIKLKTLLDWENDLNDPRANKLQMVAGVLNVSLTWLLTGEGDGLAHPEDAQTPNDALEILDDMRKVRAQIGELTGVLQTLETRLRRTLSK